MKKLIIIAVLTNSCGGTIVSTLPGAAGGDAAGAVVSLFALAASTGATTSQTSLNVISACTQTVIDDSCTTGTKAASYSGCYIGNTSFTFGGTVNLTFSSAACAFASTNDTITRTTQITRNSQNYDIVTTSSSSYTDYTGTVVGGGTKITKTAGGFDLNVLGIRKFTTNRVGAISKDASVRTTTNLTITDPTAASITFSGGVIEAVDNINKYKATYVPTSGSPLVVTYGTCCYPTSGSLDVTYTSGSVTGTAKITFSSQCGSAIIEQNGAFSQAPLMGCM